MVYEPQEDSQLLKEEINKQELKEKKVLDMGCGTGILAIEAAKKGAKVTATDIDEEAIKKTIEAAKKEGIKINTIKSNLFSKIKEKYDLIICNPPYLPNDPEDPDIALDGGPEGWEYIEKFLKEAKKHLTKEGKIILLYSTRSKEEKIKEIIKKEGYQEKELTRKGVGFFEELIVVELK